MPEETKPEVKAPEVKPAAPAVKATPAAQPTTAEIVRRLKEELKRAEKLNTKESNYGEGKPGKINFTIPKFPPEWKIPTFKTINKNGKTVFNPGQTYQLTYNEVQDLMGRYAVRGVFEVQARTGREPINLDVTGSGGNIF